MKQLIYRRDGGEVFPDVDAANIVYCGCAGDLAPLIPPLKSYFGRLGVWKMSLKLVSGRRSFYGVFADGQLLHYGWVSFGFCKYYDVEKESAVIGPIWTSESARGKGLATAALKRVVNLISAKGCQAIYIDTTEDNIACQRVIAKCGFVHASSYVRSHI